MGFGADLHPLSPGQGQFFGQDLETAAQFLRSGAVPEVPVEHAPGRWKGTEFLLDAPRRGHGRTEEGRERFILPLRTSRGRHLGRPGAHELVEIRERLHAKIEAGLHRLHLRPCTGRLHRPGNGNQGYQEREDKAGAHGRTPSGAPESGAPTVPRSARPAKTGSRAGGHRARSRDAIRGRPFGIASTGHLRAIERHIPGQWRDAAGRPMGYPGGWNTEHP